MWCKALKKYVIIDKIVQDVTVPSRIFVDLRRSGANSSRVPRALHLAESQCLVVNMHGEVTFAYVNVVTCRTLEGSLFQWPSLSFFVRRPSSYYEAGPQRRSEKAVALGSHRRP